MLIEPKGAKDRDIIINEVLVKRGFAVSKLQVDEENDTAVAKTKPRLNTRDVLKILNQSQ